MLTTVAGVLPSPLIQSESERVSAIGAKTDALGAFNLRENGFVFAFPPRRD